MAFFTEVRGRVRVFIEPPGAVSAGAQWRVDGGPWYASGATATDLPLGTRTLDFSDIPPWLRPDPLTPGRPSVVSPGRCAGCFGVPPDPR